MDQSFENSDDITLLLKRVQSLEEELEKARLAVARAYFAKVPLPLSEEELSQIAEEERGFALEDLLPELENIVQGRQP